MMAQDRAVTDKDKVWELYEEETPDGKSYTDGPSAGKPMKNVVINSISGPMSIKVTIPREAFVDMVKQYFATKGY